MCQNVFYTYSCGHVECVTYRCPKCTEPPNPVCMHRQEPQYTTLEDQLCHDCNEIYKARRKRSRARRERRAQVLFEAELDAEAHDRGPQSELQISVYEQQFLVSQQVQRAPQAQQPHSRQDPQSSSPDGKTIRPLESSKLGNMMFHSEGAATGLPPHGMYQFYTGQ